MPAGGKRGSGGGRRFAFVLVAVLLVCATAVSCSFPQHRHVPRQTVNSAGARTIAQANNWVKANLASGSRVGVDFTFPDALGPNGPITLDVLSFGGGDWHTDAFVLSTLELRHEAGLVASVGRALAWSLPVAVFGTGHTRVELRQIASGGTAELARRWQNDFAVRASAGAGLLRNPRVRTSATSAAVLRDGGLDLRASIATALLAARAHVRIVSIATDRAEAAAGRPARGMTVCLTNAGIAPSAALTTLPAGYRPSSLTQLPGGVLRLRWAIAVAPVPSLD